MSAQQIAQLLDGLLVTLRITGAGVLLAAVCAIATGIGSLSRDSIVRALSWLYVEVFRGTSALVQLFWFFFALPPLTGIRLEPQTCAILVLGLNIGAYGSEVVRGAITAVPRGQHEAGTALGLSRAQILWHVVLPQAALQMLPPMGNLVIELLKSTALVSMIAVTDLTQAALFIRDDTLQTARLFGLVLLVYFAVSWTITQGVRFLERRLAKGKLVARAHG